MNKYPLIKILRQSNGTWFGHIEDSDDGHGNIIDACLKTPEKTVKCLIKQYEEVNNIKL